MLISCHYCGLVHKRGLCKRPSNNRTKQSTHITRFYNSRAWRLKRAEIKKRDYFLCQICKQENKYIFQKLEVHHIWKLDGFFQNRLENWNLITLCKNCHVLAEKGEIRRKVLLDIAKKQETASQGLEGPF